MEVEPRVLTEDVRSVLLSAIQPDSPDFGESVQLLAEKARTSTRTIYRVLGEHYGRTMDLGLADQLALAAGGHLMSCRLAWPDGRVVDYGE